MPCDVFISHSSTDKKMADTICEFLEARGASCWIAPRNILPGEEWGDSILRGIQTCQVMVLIFSKAANDSGPVRSEVDRAMNARKVLIPFRIENVAPTGAMEFHIGRRHWLEAYTPPLERHLELLARAVLDILKPAGLEPATTSAPVTETIPLSSSNVRRAETVILPKITQADDVPMRVLLNFNHVVVAGHPSTFEIIVENVTETSILNQIEVVMESRGLERAAIKKLPRLSAGQSQRHLFEIEPIRSGNFALQCTIKCKEEMKQIALVGSRSLRINEAPATTNVVISMKDLKGNAADTSSSVGGSQLANVVPAGSIHTLNDLLDLELEENFEPLPLALDYEVSMRALANEASGHQRFQIPGSFLHQAQEGAFLKLEPTDAAPNAAAREIRMIARPSFGLGRSREDADFLTWFWPRSEANDQKTRRISKKHCVLSVQGSKIFVRDNGTSNRCMFGGVELSANGEPLERRGILKLAEIYSLDVTPFPSSTLDGPVISNLRDWRGSKTETSPGMRGSVRFIPMTSQVLPQNSTWLLTDGAFGTSRANPIILDFRGLAEIQGRIYHHLGGFWIETLASNGGVHVNGARLEPGFLIPLVTGQTLKLGDAAFRVTVAA
jgi:pSer/pThr/pTyr-binding forkhead associated (FHA) protein